MLTTSIVLVVFLAYYGSFKLCKSAATDNQQLEDELFLETFVYGEDK